MGEAALTWIAFIAGFATVKIIEDELKLLEGIQTKFNVMLKDIQFAAGEEPTSQEEDMNQNQRDSLVKINPKLRETLVKQAMTPQNVVEENVENGIHMGRVSAKGEKTGTPPAPATDKIPAVEVEPAWYEKHDYYWSWVISFFVFSIIIWIIVGLQYDPNYSGVAFPRRHFLAYSLALGPYGALLRWALGRISFITSLWPEMCLQTFLANFLGGRRMCKYNMEQQDRYLYEGRP